MFSVQVIAATGEYAIVYCPASTYAANIELAEAKESTLEVTFMGLYTLTDPKKLPGYLEIAV